MGGCVELPDLPIPALPFPFSVAPPPLVLPGFSANICCKIVALKAMTIPIPIPAAIINPTFVAGLRTAIKAVAAYKAALQIPCPRSSK